MNAHYHAQAYGGAGVHPSAQVHPSATLAADVKIGAFSVIGPHCEIGAGTEIGSHVVIDKWTRIGRNNRIFPFASLGADPQDKKYGGEETWLEIGDNNTIREFVTFNRGTVQGGGRTRLGHNNWIMANVHLAHDCLVGDDNVFANNASLAGHVVVGNRVTFGGYALIYQFVRIGDLAMVAFSAGVKQNVPPFALVEGYDARLKGINQEGLRRRNYSEEEKKAIKEAYQRLYYDNLLLAEARAELQPLAARSPAVAQLAEFIGHSDKRGLIRP